MTKPSSTPEEEKTVPLSQRMHKQTKNVHDKSDRLVNLKLGMVLTSKELYAEAISLFWPIYDTLESLLEERHKDHQQLKLLLPLLPLIRRGPKFEQDMEALLGGDKELAQKLVQRRCPQTDSKNGNKTVYSPPELQAYIDNLHRLSEENPLALLAYVYAMYGAIMAGGFIIKRMVRRAFSLKTNEGVHIFEVEVEGSGFANVKALRNEMKRILNEDMNLSKEQEDLILAESPQVFVRNNALVATVQDTFVFARATQDCIRFLALVVIAPLLVVVMAVYLARSSGSTTV
jgi:heme oxygenase